MSYGAPQFDAPMPSLITINSHGKSLLGGTIKNAMVTTAGHTMDFVIYMKKKDLRKVLFQFLKNIYSYIWYLNIVCELEIKMFISTDRIKSGFALVLLPLMQ